MNNWDKNITQRTNAGALGDSVPHEILNWLKDIMLKARGRDDYDFTGRLAGNLKKEYVIYGREHTELVKPDDENLLRYQSYIDYLCFHPFFEEFWKRQSILAKDSSLYMDNTWVNFQKKYEFNPPHTHTGLFSWIIFLNIPYNLEDENKVFPEMNIRDENNEVVFVTSRLAFLLVNPYLSGGIDHVSINVDKSFEGKIMMFPSYLQHEVFPFYTSDDYRITVSGNLYFDVDKPTS